MSRASNQRELSGPDPDQKNVRRPEGLQIAISFPVCGLLVNMSVTQLTRIFRLCQLASDHDPRRVNFKKLKLFHGG